MVYEHEINIFNEDALKNKFSTIDTQFNVTLGKISAIISDSEIEQYVDGHTTMNTRLSSVIQDLDGVHIQVSSMRNEYQNQFDIVDHRISSAELKITDSAIISTVTETTEGQDALSSVIEQNADSIRLKADKIAWDSTHSSMTEDGILTCEGANINGTINIGGEGNSEGLLNYYDETYNLAGTWSYKGIELIGEYELLRWKDALNTEHDRDVPISLNIQEGAVLFNADNCPKATIAQVPVRFKRKTINDPWQMEFSPDVGVQPEDVPLTVTATTGFQVRVTKPLKNYQYNYSPIAKIGYRITLDGNNVYNHFYGNVISHEDGYQISAYSKLLARYLDSTYVQTYFNSIDPQLKNILHNDIVSANVICRGLPGSTIPLTMNCRTNFINTMYVGNEIYVRNYNGDTYYTIFAKNFSQASDERFKDSINPLNNDVVSAIKNVELKQFKVINSDDKDGLNVGIIAQDIIKEFKNSNVDWRKYRIVSERDENGESRYFVDYQQFLIAKLAGLEQIIEEQSEHIRALESVMGGE